MKLNIGCRESSFSNQIVKCSWVLPLDEAGTKAEPIKHSQKAKQKLEGIKDLLRGH